MNLIDKIKNAGKRLARASLIASSISLAGCVGVEPGPLHPSKLLFGGTVFDSDYQRQAHSNVNNAIVPKKIEIPRNSFFTCNYFRGDLNGNGNYDIEEYEGANKKAFNSSEKIKIAFLIRHPFHFGKTLNFKVYGPNEEIVYNNDFSINSGLGRLYELEQEKRKNGRYFAEWKIEDEVVGALDFEIVDDNALKNQNKRHFVPIIPFK